jgi:hypothetical protein
MTLALNQTAMTSFTVSSPIETRTKPSVILTANLSSTDNLLCVVEAGWVTIVLVSPKFMRSEHSFILSKKLRPASIPPLFQTRQRYHLSFVLRTLLWVRFKKGYFTRLTFDAVLNSATFKAFHSACLNESVSKLLIKPKH